MIYNIQTYKTYGYWPEDLKPQSHKPIIIACYGCGKIRIMSKHTYHNLCRSCAGIKRFKDIPKQEKQIREAVQRRKQIKRIRIENGGYIVVFCNYNIKTESIHITTQFGRKSKNGMEGNRECTSFLGVHVAEQVLSKLFKNVERTPYGTPGYDFRCGKGYKVDVKGGCLGNNTPNRWLFKINKNKIADYFLCLAFDNRYDLNPIHVWLIPCEILNDKVCTSISKYKTDRWSEYEQPLNKVLKCCDVMKEMDK